MLVQGIPTQSTLRFWFAWTNPTAPSAWLDTGQLLTAAPLLYNGRQVAVLLTAENLTPNTAYTLFIRDTQGMDLVPPTPCHTLSEALQDDGALVLAVGSCYWFYAKAAALLAARYPPRFLVPDLRFLVGDQIYLDVFSSTGIPDPFMAPNVWQIYTQQWSDQNFQQFLLSTPTGILFDDHEFWNDYPHGNLQLPYLSNAATRADLERNARAALQAFQLPLNLQGQASFSFAVPPLHFYVLDTRLSRTRYTANPAQFMSPQDRADVLQWLAHLPGPGVLVIADTLITNPSPDIQRIFHTMGDVTLGDYGEDFDALWQGIIGAPHDVLLLSGDVHYGCFGEVTTNTSRYARPGPRLGKVYECISSALGLLTTAKSNYDKPPKFDLSGALARHEYLPYTNHFATPRGVENYALLRFTKLNDGVEFDVYFYELNNSLFFEPPTGAKYVLV